MGCGGSSDRGKGSPNGSSNTNSYTRRPRISVRLDDQVKKLEADPVIIFIFGGPGSRKGRVVDDLVNSYGLSFIRGEDLVLQELPKKLQTVIKLETSKEIQEFIRDDPSHVTLEWMLKLVKTRLENNKKGGVVIDLVPNLKVNLRNDSLSQDCTEELAEFEEKYPISFALNLAIPADKVLNAKRGYCATPDNATKLKETGGQSDEADSSRTQKRAQIYENSVKTFLEYFRKSQRLVTVDVTCGQPDIIWNGVHETMARLEFKAVRNVNTVILFNFESSQADNIDHAKYMMERINLRDLVQNTSDHPKSLLKQLCMYLDKHAEACESFVADVSGTTITNRMNANMIKNDTRKPVMFNNVSEGYLEDHLPGGSTKTPMSGSKPYKSVISTENIICLFPMDTSAPTCQSISLFVAENTSF